MPLVGDFPKEVSNPSRVSRVRCLGFRAGRYLESAAIIVKGDDMARRGYPPELLPRVVELLEGGQKVAEVAADLGIGEQTISTRRRQA